MNFTRCNAADPSPAVNLYTACAKLLICVTAKLFAQLGQNVVARMNEHDAQHLRFEKRIKWQHVVQEIVDAGDRFHASKTTTSYNERQQRFALFGGAFRVGFLQVRDKSIAQLNGVAQRLHCQRTLFKSWQLEKVGDRAQSKHEVVVLERVGVVVETVRHHNRALLQIDALNIAREKIDVAQHLAHRIDDVHDVEIARCDLVQHWRKEEEVIPVHQRDFDVRIFPPLKLQRGIKAGKATTENEYA